MAQRGQKKKFMVDAAVMFYNTETCSSRSCSSCPEAMRKSCSGTKTQVIEKIGVKIKAENGYPPAGMIVAIRRKSDDVMFVGTMLYEDDIPLAWQNCADKTDLYMLEDVYWAPILGTVEVEV